MSHSIKLVVNRLAPDKIFGPNALQLGWFSLSYLIFPTKAERRINTGKWFCIESTDGKIYRVLRFSPRLSFCSKDKKAQIVLDYDGWLHVLGYNEDTSKSLAVSIRRAEWYELLKCVLTHPEPAYRLAGWLATISVILGILSLVIGILPMLNGGLIKQ
jgi:hypothetical protein